MYRSKDYLTEITKNETWPKCFSPATLSSLCHFASQNMRGVLNGGFAVCDAAQSLFLFVYSVIVPVPVVGKRNSSVPGGSHLD